MAYGYGAALVAPQTQHKRPAAVGPGSLAQSGTLSVKRRAAAL